MKIPKHQERYARAWTLYKDKGMSPEYYNTLENEMDDAQNNFTFEEFQEFKKTLPGFKEHWNKFTGDMLEALESYDKFK